MWTLYLLAAMLTLDPVLPKHQLSKPTLRSPKIGTIVCELNSNDVTKIGTDVTYQFFQNGRLLARNTRDATNNTYRITSSHNDSCGLYTCTVTSGGHNQFSNGYVFEICGKTDPGARIIGISTGLLVIVSMLLWGFWEFWYTVDEPCRGWRNLFTAAVDEDADQETDEDFQFYTTLGPRESLKMDKNGASSRSSESLDSKATRKSMRFNTLLAPFRNMIKPQEGQSDRSSDSASTGSTPENRSVVSSVTTSSKNSAGEKSGHEKSEHEKSGHEKSGHKKSGHEKSGHQKGGKKLTPTTSPTTSHHTRV